MPNGVQGERKLKIAFGILKNKFQILNNLNSNLKYAPTIVTACCILHNFMIDEGGTSEIEIMDNELNSAWPFNLDYSREERRSQTIAKEQREILFQNWMRSIRVKLQLKLTKKDSRQLKL